MNAKKIIHGIVVATALLAAQSCDKIKDFKDVNVNPNQTTTPIPSALLTNVESGFGANLVFDAGGVNSGAALYCQYFSETQYTEVSRYNKPTYNYDAYYSGPLEDLQNIINYNTDAATAGAAAVYGSNNNQIAIARILKAHYYKFITDAVGDIPYSKALQGSTGVITTPYDKQQDIYPDLLKELKEAIAQFDEGPLVQGDIIYGAGDNTSQINHWKKDANSLRLLIALNMEKVDAATGKTEFLAALNDPAGIIASNSDNLTLNYPGGVYPNPYYNYYNITQRFDYAVSKTMTDQLSTTNDPRLPVYASSTKGFPYGLTRDDAVTFANGNPDYAKVFSDNYRQTASPLTILSASYIDLIRAEAAQLGWTSENVGTLYTSGIQASFDQWGIAAGGYLSGGSVALAGNATDLQKIATQEWLAAYANGPEGWNIYRRTGFPALSPAPGLSAIPRRVPYGKDDYDYNATNVAIAAAGYTVSSTPDSQAGRIWWDK